MYAGRPIAGLLTDLKDRGLLRDTLVLWGGEFGRTPTAEGTNGRDHNPEGFTVWLAGGGVKGGFRYGATDDYGYYAVEDRAFLDAVAADRAPDPGPAEAVRAHVLVEAVYAAARKGTSVASALLA